MNSARRPLEHFGILPESADADLLRLVLTTAVETIDADEGSLLLRDDGTGDLRFAMTVGDPDREKTLIGERVPVGQGVVQLAAATQEVQIGAPTFRDIKQTERETGGPEAVIAAPMISGSDVIGVLTAVTFKHGRRFGGTEAKLYGRLATVAAVLIEQHQRISGAEDRIAVQTTAMHPKHNKELNEIDQALNRIASRHPQALSHIAAIVANFEAAIEY
jgi:GAF domain-containing protein